jgi:hypothetical protein
MAESCDPAEKTVICSAWVILLIVVRAQLVEDGVSVMLRKSFVLCSFNA